MTAVARIADAGTFLAIRETAREIREQVEALNRPVTLDFGGVEAITNGFADELVGKLLSGGHDVVIEGANAEVWDALETVAARRGLGLCRSQP